MTKYEPSNISNKILLNLSIIILTNLPVVCVKQLFEENFSQQYI